MSLTELFMDKIREHGDMSPSMELLRLYAKFCPRVVEFGVRHGSSTTAFLMGGAEVWSYDNGLVDFVAPEEMAGKWHLSTESTLEIKDIPQCDFLFIDTVHTFFQVQAELRFAHRVNHFIGLHDTVSYGKRGEDGGLGINLAIFDFLCANHEWRIREHHDDPWGLTILTKD